MFSASGDGGKVSASPQTVPVRPPANVAGSKEFDPLSTQKSVEENTQNKVMSSFGISASERKLLDLSLTVVIIKH